MAVKANGKAPAESNVEAIARIRRLERVEYTIDIEGTAPLIAHAWSEKARRMMLDAQQSSARKKKDAKDPVAEFEAAKYRIADGADGFPAVAFKAAIVNAARLFEGVHMVTVKQTIRVTGDGFDINGNDLVALRFESITLREDMPRNTGGGADLRYRPQYNDWGATLRVQAVVGQVDEESLLALVDAAGIGGVGDWRPSAPKSATGSYGTFQVVADSLLETNR